MPSVITRAPARVCLFGDHQDYLRLPIIACAIDKYIDIKGSANQTSQLRISKPDLSESLTIDLHARNPSTIDFLELGLYVVKNHGFNLSKGYDIKVTGDIPINAGLSSSSAMMVAWIRFLLKIADPQKEIEPEQVAKMAYEAEVIERGGAGGKMDQYSISIGGLIHLDTETDHITKLPINLPQTIVGVSGENKDTQGMLASLKNAAFLSIRQMKKHTPDFSISDADEHDVALARTILNGSLFLVFEAAVHNHLITKRALEEFALPYPNFEFLGQLINSHHHYLSHNLKITTKRIDGMINNSLNAGALGAKIVGSGGGGCIVALARKGQTEAVINAILEAGAIDAFMANPAGIE